MIVDGKALAAEIIEEIKVAVLALPKPPRLTVFTCEPNFETQKFLHLKEAKAAAAGIALDLVTLPENVTLSEVREAVTAAAASCDGIIIQFPFPHLATSELIPLIPVTHDVDVMQYTGWSTDPLPPVVGAIAEMVKRYSVVWENKEVVVVGNGRLVGAPAASYARGLGAHVTVVTKESDNLAATKTSDIIILGAGVPALLKPDMVKEGVIVFDAGTSEEGGMLVGDADPSVAERATLFTPVPGGIGPLTVAILLKNVLYLAKQNSK